MVDDLLHFFLLLLILQRFDDAKWGYFTECPQSGVRLEPMEKTLTYSFGAGTATCERTKVISYPDHHNIHLGITLIGRGTNVIGGRVGPPPGPVACMSKASITKGRLSATGFVQTKFFHHGFERWMGRDGYVVTVAHGHARNAGQWTGG